MDQKILQSMKNGKYTVLPPQNSFNYSTVKDFLAYFLLSTLRMEFSFNLLCTLWNKHYFTSSVVGNFETLFHHSRKSKKVISTMWKI